MKNMYKIIIGIGLLFSVMLAHGQAPRIVEVLGYDLNNPKGSVGDYNNVLWDAIFRDSVERAKNPNTIYQLKRNHIYPMGKIIQNNFPLHIQGEEGEGFMAEISVGLKTDGSTGNDFIDSYDHLTLENIYFNGSEGGGAYLHRMIEMRAPNTRLIYDGCAMTGDNSGGVVLKADSLKVYVRNSIMGNMGHRYVMNGNGRFIEIRGEAPYVDTLVIENCITYNLTDRVLRNEGSFINYVKIDHLTALNTVGRNGGIELSNAKTAVISNNVLANVISIGHTDAHAAEQQQADGHFAAITLDTLFADQSIEVRNNNIYWDKALQDVWSLFDTVEAPNYICSTVKAAIGDANVEKAYFTEPLVFNKTSDNIAAYVANFYADPVSEDLPDSWCVGGDGGLYYDEIDVSYDKSYKSYTADDNGMPVGCQLKFDFTIGVFEQMNRNTLNATCYPNPFTASTAIEFSMNEAAEVNVQVFNTIGAQVMPNIVKNMEAGTNSITINASNLPSGIYFCAVSANGLNKTFKMILDK